MWLHKKLKEDLKTKEDMYRKWKEGQATKEEYRQAARKCRDGLRRAKAENEMKLARDTKSNKKAFFRYVSRKRQTKDMVAQLRDGDGKMVTEDKGKAEALDSYFSSVFSHKTDDGLPNKWEVQGGGQDCSWR